jgi:hypothetical protein
MGTGFRKKIMVKQRASQSGMLIQRKIIPLWPATHCSILAARRGRYRYGGLLPVLFLLLQ